MESLNDSLTEYRKIKPNSKAIQSYDKYLHRLQTYQLHKWFAKPLEFSPIECARRGWFNLNKDTLKCELCSNILYHHSQSPLTTVKMAKFSSIKYDEKCVTNPKSLDEKHDNFCPWRAYKIPDRFILIDIYDEENLHRNFIDRLQTFKKCALLPCLDEKIFSLMDKDDILDSNESDESKESFEIKHILSCCGWTYNEHKDTLNCEKCLRKVGLWLYNRVNNLENSKSAIKQTNTEFENCKTNHKSNSDELVVKNILYKIVNLISINEENHSNKPINEENEACIKRKSHHYSQGSFYSNFKTDKKTFNPLTEHQSWCPWLFESDSQLSTINLESKSKKILKNMSILSFEIICQKIKSINQINDLKYKKEKIKEEQKLKSNDLINSETLLSRIKSVQSILVNCSSQLSQL